MKRSIPLLPILCLTVLSCSVGKHRYPAPDWDTLQNPRIPCYIEKDHTFFDSVLGVFFSVDTALDVSGGISPQVPLEARIIIESSQLTVVVSEKHCRAFPDFVDAPDLAGYFLHDGHICYIYSEECEARKTISNCLFTLSSDSAPLDSIDKSVMRSDCHSSKMVFQLQEDGSLIQVRQP